MASAHYTLSSLLEPHTKGRTSHRIPFSSKRHRKNHLRPKILKTLTTPYPPTLPLLPSPPPPQPIVCPQENNNLCVEVPADETLAGESDKLEELQISESTAKENGVFENVTAADIFKYGGMYFLGALVLQTIYTVWVMQNYNSNQKDGDLEIDGRERGDVKTVSLPVNGAAASNVFRVEEQLGMEKKIEEIRLMAREARRIESEKKGDEDEDEDEDFEMEDDEGTVSSHRLGIEKEIGARLLKLQNRINGSAKDISAALQINTRGNSAAGMDRGVNKNVNRGNEALVFNKKFKFRSPSTKATKTPKGFPGTRDWRASSAKKRDSESKEAAQDYESDASDHSQMLYEDKQGSQQDVVTQRSISSVTPEGGKFVDDESKVVLKNGKNLKEKREKPSTKTEVGVKTRSTDNSAAVPESNFGMSSLEGVQSRKSRDSSIQNSQAFVQEKQDRGPIFEKDGVHSINGSLRHGLAKKKSAADRGEVKQANTKTDIWWLNLRYVFVILMQRDSEEGSTGLYSVKFASKEQDQSDDSYAVAFEDHADANNLCFLLESFFKDLGSFSADAIPMSMQELNEEIISRAKKVVVVKKRQLQLYAGQPLADVEMALCSIIEQDQNAPATRNVHDEVLNEETATLPHLEKIRGVSLPSKSKVGVDGADCWAERSSNFSIINRGV
ncbi:hypothetical protein CR513_11592, partial [Mucuna pruriens]